MKKLKSISAVAMSAALLLTSTACNGGGGTADAGTTTTTTMEVRTTFEQDEGVLDAIGGVGDTAVSDEVDPTTFKKIQFLSWWEIFETGAPIELFKSLYGVPEEGDASYGEDADHVVDYINVAYASRYDKLASLAASGDAPDIFPYDILNYPYAIYKGMFQTVDTIADVTTDDWADAADTYAQFQWNGANYLMYNDLWSTESLFWYRTSVAEEAGLDDPRELYEAGQWDWDAFLNMAEKFQQSGDGKYICDGWSVHYCFLDTTGTPLISLDNGKLLSNLTNPNIERAAEYLTKLRTQNYRYPRHELNDFNPNFNAWTSGDILFYCDGIWMYQGNNLNRYVKKFQWDDVTFVPAPRDPQADKYYQSMAVDAFFFCAGSDNTDAVKALWQCYRACAKDETVKAASWEQDKAQYSAIEYNPQILEWVDEYLHGDNLTPVFDFKNGIGQDIANGSTSDNCVDKLLNGVYLDGLTTYTEMRAENEGQINSRIDELNKSAS